MSAIFGGSKQSSSSTSSNQAYPYVQQQFSGMAGNGAHANDALYSLLTGGAGSGEAFNNYKNSAGYQSTLDAGSHAVTGNAASRGLMNSGATGKALVNYGQGLNQQYYNNYLSQLLGLGQQGLGAGGLIAGAGQTSHSTSSGSSKPGIGGFLGSLASAVPGL